MASWEEVVNDVVLGSNPPTLQKVAGEWDVVFDGMRAVKTDLQTLIKDLHSWKGKGAESYKKEINKYITALGKSDEDNSPIIQTLNSSADALNTAISQIPIPSWKLDELRQKQQDLYNSGQTYGDALFGSGDFLKSFAAGPGAGFFDAAANFLPGAKSLAGWFNNNEDDSIKALNDLNNTNENNIVPNAPDGAPAAGKAQYNPTDFNGTGTGTGTGTGSLPSTGTPKLPDTKTPNTNLPNTDLPNTDHPNTDLPNVDYPPNNTDLPNSKVPSAGHVGGVPSGAGLSGGGAGLGTAGLGGGGLGGGGLGGGLGGNVPTKLGPSVSPLSGAGGFGGVPLGAAGRGAGGKGSGQSGRSAGIVPSRGGHGSENEDDRSTWLVEDDDVWGSDTDAAPPVLGQ
jgi:hypothetical protein